MTCTLPLMEKAASRGAVECRQEGCYLVFSVDAAPWGRGLKKVWLRGRNGSRMLLGTLQPEMGRLRLCRKVSRSALRCCGLTEFCEAVVNPDETEAVTPALPDGWNSLDTLPFEEEEICRLLRSGYGGMWRREGRTVHIRYPWKEGEPVPVMPLFRFGCKRGDWWEVVLSS